MVYRMTIDFETDIPPTLMATDYAVRAVGIDFPGLAWDELAEQPTGIDRPARVMIDGGILGVELIELEPSE